MLVIVPSELVCEKEKKKSIFITLRLRRLAGLVGEGLGDFPDRGVDSWLPAVPLAVAVNKGVKSAEWLNNTENTQTETRTPTGTVGWGRLAPARHPTASWGGTTLQRGQAAIWCRLCHPAFWGVKGNKNLDCCRDIFYRKILLNCAKWLKFTWYCKAMWRTDTIYKCCALVYKSHSHCTKD